MNRNCAKVPGVFPIMEETGVCEGVVQSVHKDPLVTESLCQPITLETALKALQKGIANPAKMVSSLMDDQVNALNNPMSIHPTEPRVQTSCNEALSKLNPYLFNPIPNPTT